MQNNKEEPKAWGNITEPEFHEFWNMLKKAYPDDEVDRAGAEDMLRRALMYGSVILRDYNLRVKALRDATTTPTMQDTTDRS